MFSCRSEHFGHFLPSTSIFRWNLNLICSDGEHCKSINVLRVGRTTTILTRRGFKVQRLHNNFLTQFGGRDMHRTTDSPDYNNQIFLAQLLTGFFALFGLGEMTYPDDPELCNPRKVTKHNSISVSNDSFQFSCLDTRPTGSLREISSSSEKSAPLRPSQTLPHLPPSMRQKNSLSTPHYGWPAKV